MSKFYPASKNSTNPLKDINSDSFVPPEAQIAFATKYKYLPTADLYGSLGDCTILSNGTGIPYNTQLIFPEPTISGGILASGTPIFGLSNYSINIIDGGSGHYIGDKYYVFNNSSFIPSVLKVSTTGLNGSVDTFEVSFPGKNYTNNSEINYSLENNANKTSAIIEFVPDNYSIVDINIYPYSNGYKVFSSNKLKSKIPYFINTNNDYGFIAYSIVGNIITNNLFLDIKETTKDRSRFDRINTNQSIFTNPEVRPTTNAIFEDSNIIYPTISVLNNQTIYSYTTSCVDDSDCSFCASGVLISSGDCETFEGIFPSGSTVRPCTEYDAEQGGNSACEAFQLISGGSDCTDCYTDGNQVAYVECVKKCCPEGSTGVFLVGDQRAGRCCEDCSETSVEEGQYGWLLTEGYCVDGQCSETPESTGVSPTGESPANTGCVENLPENSGNPTFTFDIDPSILTGLGGGLGFGAFANKPSSATQTRRMVERIGKIYEQYDPSISTIQRWIDYEINQIIKKGLLSERILFPGGSDGWATGKNKTKIIDDYAESLRRKNQWSEDKMKKFKKHLDFTIERLAKMPKPKLPESAKQDKKNKNSDKQRQDQQKQQKKKPFTIGPDQPPPKWPYGQAEWDRIENNRKKREKCFGINLDNAQYNWNGMSKSDKRRLISRSLIGLIAGGSLLAYQIFARGGEYEDETINEIVDWIDFIGQADPSTPLIDTLIGSQLGDATFEEYMATAEQLLGGLIGGQITQEQINEILNSMDSVTRNQVEQSMKIKMGIDSESPLSDAIDKANEYKQTIEELSDSDAINNALPDIQFNDENPYDYFYNKEGNFKPLEEILPPSADESEDCNSNCYEKDNSYSYLRAKPKPTIPVSMEYPVLKANEFYG